MLADSHAKGLTNPHNSIPGMQAASISTNEIKSLVDIGFSAQSGSARYVHFFGGCDSQMKGSTIMFGVCFTGSRTWLAKPNNRHRQVGISEAQTMSESEAIKLATAQGTYFGNRPMAMACEIHREKDGSFYIRRVGTSDWGHWIGY